MTETGRLAPILADLFTTKMEQKLNRFSTNRTKMWLRYVDDLFYIFEVNIDKILVFLEQINR
jgi:hypothetical protein